ncbi:MAG: DUF2971 domain-containing protein [Pseudomonadota bacterium]
MDFTKFVAMLESSSLFFSRADRLGDPFEGSYSRGNERLRPEVYKEIYDKMSVDVVEKMHQGQAQHYKWQRQWTFINCWHMNIGESAGMWKLYAKTNEAIAIKSSFSCLANQLDSETYIGVVEYIDFDHDWLPEGNALYPYVHKRRSFAHEQEVRALFVDWPVTEAGFNLQAVPPESGLERKVDIQELVEAVYVAPTCPSWFRTLVKQVCHRYGLTKRVVQSSLDAEPFF